MSWYIPALLHSTVLTLSCHSLLEIGEGSRRASNRVAPMAHLRLWHIVPFMITEQLMQVFVGTSPKSVSAGLSQSGGSLAMICSYPISIAHALGTILFFFFYEIVFYHAAGQTTLEFHQHCSDMGAVHCKVVFFSSFAISHNVTTPSCCCILNITAVS